MRPLDASWRLFWRLAFLCFVRGRPTSFQGLHGTADRANPPASQSVAIAAPVATDTKKSPVAASLFRKDALPIPAKTIAAPAPKTSASPPRPLGVTLEYVPGSSTKLEQLIGQENIRKDTSPRPAALSNATRYGALNLVLRSNMTDTPTFFLAIRWGAKAKRQYHRYQRCKRPSVGRSIELYDRWRPVYDD